MKTMPSGPVGVIPADRASPQVVHGRRGIALPVVLLALIVISALVSGAFFSSTQEHYTGRNAIEQTRATIAADHGLARTIAGWPGSGASSLDVGGSSMATDTLQHGLTIATVITRTGLLTYWVESEGRASAGSRMEARRKVGGLIRLDVPEIFLPGALTIRQPSGTGRGEVGEGTVVAGADVTPGNWSDCPDAGPGLAGLATNDTSQWRLPDDGCTDQTCFSGEPPLLESPPLGDSSAASADFAEAWEALAGRATIALDGGITAGTSEQPLAPRELEGQCDREHLFNWGDPDRRTSCSSYFPVVHVAGTLHMAGGRGQGVLLVDGDLELSGGAVFVGLVLVRGTLRTTAPGAHVVGGIRVADEWDRGSSLAAGGRFQFSRCAIATVLAPHGTPGFEPRSWVELRR